MQNLNEFERKLLRLALDPAASKGESHAAAAKLVDALRRRGVREYDLEEKEPLTYDWSQTVIRFGKYKGRPICDVPVDYLMWVLENCENANRALLLAIKIYLCLEEKQE